MLTSAHTSIFLDFDGYLINSKKTNLTDFSRMSLRESQVCVFFLSKLFENNDIFDN